MWALRASALCAAFLIVVACNRLGGSLLLPASPLSARPIPTPRPTALIGCQVQLKTAV